MAKTSKNKNKTVPLLCTLLSLFFLQYPTKAISAPAETWTIWSFKDPLVIQSGQKSIRPSLNQTLPKSGLIKLGSSATLALNSSEGNEMTIIGPAQFSWTSNHEFIFDWGSYFVDASQGTKAQIIWNDGKFKADDKKFYLESNINHDIVRFSNLSSSVIQITSVKKSLAAGETYVRSGSATQIVSTGPDELEYNRKRFLNARLARDLGSPLEPILPPISIPNIFAVGFTTGTSRLTPSSPDYIQNTGSLGLMLHYVYHYYFGFPQKPLRIHYMNKLALRLGTQAEYHSASIKPSIGANTSTSIMRSHALVGISAQGVAIDALGGAEIISGNGMVGERSWGWLGQMSFRFDGEEFWGFPCDIWLGLQYTQAPLIRGSGAEKAVLKWNWLGVFLTTAVRF